MHLFHYHLVTSQLREVEGRYLAKLGFDLVARYGRIGDEQLIMRVDEGHTPPATGDTVRIAARQDKLHWFDAGSGKRTA